MRSWAGLIGLRSSRGTPKKRTILSVWGCRWWTWSLLLSLNCGTFQGSACHGPSWGRTRWERAPFSSQKGTQRRPMRLWDHEFQWPFHSIFQTGTVWFSRVSLLLDNSKAKSQDLPHPRPGRVTVFGSWWTFGGWFWKLRMAPFGAKG